MAKKQMRHCFNCGEELGVYANHDPLDTCGREECNRKARNQAEMDREAARKIDRDDG
jgi:hypothetical protein